MQFSKTFLLKSIEVWADAVLAFSVSALKLFTAAGLSNLKITKYFGICSFNQRGANVPKLCE